MSYQDFSIVSELPANAQISLEPSHSASWWGVCWKTFWGISHPLQIGTPLRTRLGGSKIHRPSARKLCRERRGLPGRRWSHCPCWHWSPHVLLPPCASLPPALPLVLAPSSLRQGKAGKVTRDSGASQLWKNGSYQASKSAYIITIHDPCITIWEPLS